MILRLHGNLFKIWTGFHENPFVYPIHSRQPTFELLVRFVLIPQRIMEEHK